jgi:hypothetical protein
MAPWQRIGGHDETEVDGRVEASRQAFIARHDAAFDFEAGWAEIVRRADTTTRSSPRLVAVEPVDRRRDGHAATNPAPAVADLHRRSGRRRLMARVGSIAAAAAMVAAIVVGTDDKAEADLAPRIVHATRSALADSIEHEISDWTWTALPVDAETWRDQTTAAIRSLNYAADGSGRSLDWGPLVSPTPDDEEPTLGPFPVLAVDYCFGEYEIEEFPVPEGVTDVNASIARSVAEGLDDGSMRTDGTEVVDGQLLIRVVEVGGSESLAWYVDPGTYRPVRIADPVEGYVTTIEYLPRTPDLLAQFTPVIPEGLVQVDELTRTDDYRPCS